ncbi:MAG TPA: threonylcarbamoyl-AMP synthase, partial [Trinickia sp.]|nr:threonylcarbamoyl-AMP synthase [Trinickia sp.]
MSQYFRIHPETPQPRLISQAIEIVKDGGVIALP